MDLENKQTDPQREDSERAEKRKKRRKKERLQALAIVGGAALVLVLIIVGIISAVVHAVTSKKTGNTDSGKADDQVVMQEEADSDVAEEANLSSDDSSVKEETTDSGDDENEDKTTNESASASDGDADTTEGEAGAIEGEAGSIEGEAGAIEGEAGAIEGEAGAIETADTEDPVDGTDSSEETVQTAGDSGKKDSTSSKTDDTLSSLLKKDITAHDEEIKKEIAEMTLEQKISKLFIITPGQLTGTEIEPTNVGSKVGEKLAAYPVSGLLIKKQNLKSEEELKSMVSNIRLMSQGNLFLVIEDAGGPESPFVTSGITENVVASQKEIGETLGSAGAYSAGISIGSQLKHYEFTVDLAPTADVSKSPSSYAAGHGFGTDMETTADLTKNMVRGLKDQGVLSVVCSFPGYGDVNGNGSSGPISTQRSKEQLIEDSKPYQEAIKAGADMVMISHVGIPKLRGDQRPASLSKELITDIVRDEWEYDGVVITDYMDKTCIYTKYTYAEAAAGAIEAGADILLATKNFQKSYNGVLDAVKKGQISEERIDESVLRIYRLFYQLKDAENAE